MRLFVKKRVSSTFRNTNWGVELLFSICDKMLLGLIWNLLKPYWHNLKDIYPIYEWFWTDSPKFVRFIGVCNLADGAVLIRLFTNCVSPNSWRFKWKKMIRNLNISSSSLTNIWWMTLPCLESLRSVTYHFLAFLHKCHPHYPHPWIKK